jgi:hypothetical protein
MLDEESRSIIQLISDSEGKLVGLVGDKRSYADCPVGFAPSEDFVGTLRLALLREANSARDDAIYFQYALEMLETAWSKLINLLETSEKQQ